MKMNVRFRLLSALALPILLVVLSGAARAGSTGDVAKELERARQLFSRKDFRNACRAYTKADELAQGKSAPSLIGLSDCYTQTKEWDKAVETARQALAVAANPDERTQATGALGRALLHQPDEKAWAEAAALFKEEMASSGGAEGAGGLFAALLALHRDAEAAETLRSLRNGGRSEDDVQHLLCGMLDDGSKDPDHDLKVAARNDFVRKLDPDAPLRVGGKVKRPEIRSQAKPEMPPEARRHHGVDYTVILETIIDTQGRVQSTRVLKGQPWGLTESAVQAVRQWIFSPATLDGAPVRVCYVLTVSFRSEIAP
ncbi:MAG: TonB family protein [Thermoanaerobaculia bacterium]